MNDDDSAVAKYARASETKTEEDPVETIGGFGVRRSSSGLSVMLDLRFQSGDRLALPYSHLVDLAIGGGSTITARFTTATVTLRGRGLAGLYDRLAEQRVAWVREADRIDVFDTAETSDDVVVEQIEVRTEEPGSPG